MLNFDERFKTSNVLKKDMTGLGVLNDMKKVVERNQHLYGTYKKKKREFHLVKQDWDFLINIR